jgi:threonine synthase
VRRLHPARTARLARAGLGRRARGNLGNASALGKGFREAVALGLIDRLPRIGVVQAAGAAPFARVFRDGGVLEPVKAETTASAIRIGAPASWRKALAEVRASRGTVSSVDDAAIADARAVIGRDGIGCEPASAATLAGCAPFAPPARSAATKTSCSC